MSDELAEDLTPTAPDLGGSPAFADGVGADAEGVFTQFFSAEGPLEFLESQFCDYFADDLSVNDAASVVAAAMLRAETGCEQLIADQVDPSDLAAMGIVVLDDDDDVRVQSFSTSRWSPEALLYFCAGQADPLDQIVVLYTTVGGDQTSRTATWPFSMETAVELTTPPAPVETEVIVTLPTGLAMARTLVSALILKPLGADVDPLRAATLGATLGGSAALLVRHLVTRTYRSARRRSA